MKSKAPKVLTKIGLENFSLCPQQGYKTKIMTAQVAPICKKGGLSAGSTTVATNKETTTKRLRCTDV